MLHRLVQQPAATLLAQAEDAAGAGLPQFVKEEFDALLECGILAQGFLRLHRGGPVAVQFGAGVQGVTGGLIEWRKVQIKAL